MDSFELAQLQYAQDCVWGHDVNKKFAHTRFTEAIREGHLFVTI